jgi:hypothetical protein
MALLVTTLLLLVISIMGLTALQHASDEKVSAASSRRKLETLYAADAAINVLAERLENANAISTSLTQPMDEPTFMLTEFGFPISVQTGTPDSASPEPIYKVGRASGQGSQLNLGSGYTQSYGIYRASVVATHPSGARAQIQAQFLVPEGSPTY